MGKLLTHRAGMATIQGDLPRSYPAQTEERENAEPCVKGEIAAHSCSTQCGRALELWDMRVALLDEHSPAKVGSMTMDQLG